MDKLFIDIAKFIYHKYKDQLHKVIEDDLASVSSRHTRQSDLSYINRLAGSNGARGGNANRLRANSASNNDNSYKRRGGMKCCGGGGS